MDTKSKRGVGSGGFGEVYFAVSDSGKEVALKRVQRNLDVELRGVRQCLNLKHPNLLSLYDIKQDDAGETWIVMEYMAGDNLQQAIERHPQGMPLEDVEMWLRGIVAGVRTLHDQGIVHRDLKPGNVFRDQLLVKIGDYGLSKFISCSRRSGQTESVGTFHYMAPEIGRGRYGKEIDIYAFGVMLYEMLTGRVPFDGESSQEIIMKHLTAEPDVSALPSPYRQVVGSCLAKDPVDRPDSFDTIAHHLGIDMGEGATSYQFVDSRPRVSPRPLPVVAEPTPEEPLMKWVRETVGQWADRWARRSAAHSGSCRSDRSGGDRHRVSVTLDSTDHIDAVPRIRRVLCRLVNVGNRMETSARPIKTQLPATP